MQAALKPEIFRKLYKDFAGQNPKWNEIPSTTGNVYEWDAKSTYIQEPPFFTNFSMQPGQIHEIKGARALGIFGDSVTTDHISPAGSIKKTSPAGKYLIEHGVDYADFNSYGSRRGNDRVMTRGTFANVRIKNLMVPGVEGGVTKFQGNGDVLSIFDAAEKYAVNKTPLIVLSGQGMERAVRAIGQPRERNLLGVKVVVAQSFERIHRVQTLVGMGGAAAAIQGRRHRPVPQAGRNGNLRRARVGRKLEAPAGRDAAHHPRQRPVRGRAGALPY